MKDAFKPRSVAARLTTTSTTIYTTPPMFTGELESFLFTNVTNAAATMTIEWYSPTTLLWYPLLKDHVLPGHDHHQIENSLYLERGSMLRASTGTHDSIVITLKIKEYFNQNNV